MTHDEFNRLPLAVKPGDVKRVLGVNSKGLNALVASGQLKPIGNGRDHGKRKFAKWQLANILGMKC